VRPAGSPRRRPAGAGERGGCGDRASYRVIVAREGGKGGRLRWIRLSRRSGRQRGTPRPGRPAGCHLSSARGAAVPNYGQGQTIGLVDVYGSPAAAGDLWHLDDAFFPAMRRRVRRGRGAAGETAAERRVGVLRGTVSPASSPPDLLRRLAKPAATRTPSPAPAPGGRGGKRRAVSGASPGSRSLPGCWTGTAGTSSQEATRPPRALHPALRPRQLPRLPPAAGAPVAGADVPLREAQALPPQRC
jgi:hypothetical protein